MKWSELTIRERDALVAKHVLGCQVVDGLICGCDGAPHRRPGHRSKYRPFLADYTSDWPAIEPVGKAMGVKGFALMMTPSSNGWIVSVCKSGDGGYGTERNWPLPELVAYVCLRALLDVDLEE